MYNETVVTSVKYLAGFFDADGSLGVYDGKLNVNVSQKTLMPLPLFKALWGGSIYTRKNGQHIWKTTDSSAGRALREMLPWLIVKKDQAVLGIEFANTLGQRGNRYKAMPLEILARRHEIATALKEAKRV